MGFDIGKGLYLGIDFGTTNSVVSIYDYDKDSVYTVPIDGSLLFPSVIQYEFDEDEEGKLVKNYGIQAKEAAMIYPDSTIMSVKRLLGQDESIKVIVEGQTYEFKPEEVVADLLSYMKEQANQYIFDVLGVKEGFTGCVITVPANSSDKQKQRTKEAAVMAGFNEETVFLRLEPAAAAISYAVNANEDKKVLVYDFGGGTFDACIMEISKGEMTVLSTYGDNNLGGNDLDKLMMDLIYDQFCKLTDGKIDLFDYNVDDGVSKKVKKIAQVRLYNAANAAKERLSEMKSTKIVLAPFIQEPTLINLQMEVTREAYLHHKRKYTLGDSKDYFEKFEGKSVNDLIEETIRCTNICLEKAKLSASDIDEIFLVGGTSSIPEIASRITQFFGKPPYATKISPALSISVGAAYYCNHIMLGSGFKVIERTIHPLGLEISGRRFLEIVPRNMEIPKEGLRVSTTSPLMTNYDNVTSMSIVVYEDMSQGPNDGLRFVYEDGMRRLGATTLRGIPAAPKGEQSVNVVFHVGQDNILTVEASSTGTAGVTTRLSVDKMYE